MDKTFDEAIAGIRKAERGVEVREDIAQGMEYVEQFATTATQKADEAATSAAKAEKASQDTEAAKETAVSAINTAKSEATDEINTEKSGALSAIGNKKVESLQELSKKQGEALNEISKSVSAAQDAAGTAAQKAAAAAGSASNAAKSEKNAKASENAAQEHQTGAESAQKKAEDAAKRAAAIVSTDKTLSIDGAPADAKATGDALVGKLPLSGGTMTGPLILAGGLTALGYANNAGNRNAMPPRDRSLGAPTSEHFEMIASDKYNELFLGDYWTVDGVDWVIGDFKFWHNTGDTACTKPHVVAFPRNNLYAYKFNPTSTTEGGYVGSDMHKNGLTQAKQMVVAAFGSAHILNHREYLVNAVINGKPTGSDWYNSTVELMNENMVYGGRQFTPMPDGTDPWSTCRNYTSDKSQLSLFRYEPWMIVNRGQYWLRDVVSASRFAHVSSSGLANCGLAGNADGVRPVVGIC